jgi:hypothetical protein
LSTPATRESPVGVYPIVPADGTADNYLLTHLPGSLTIEPAEPLLTWETPQPLLYGTPLDERQLNAEAALSGTFTYDPPAGAVLPAGDHVLEVVFAPDDTLNYAPATAQVSLTVFHGLPSIDRQPAHQTVAKGGAVVFAVEAAGVEPLEYQWFKDGEPLVGTDQSALLIASAGLTDAGAYHVLVSDMGGSVSSQIAHLSVMDLRLEWEASTPRITVAIAGALHNQYRIDYTDSLASPITWETLASLTLEGAEVEATDPDSPELPWRFYRVILLDAP